MLKKHRGRGLMLTKIVSNPNFTQDAIDLLDLKMQPSAFTNHLRELHTQKPTSVEKLITLVDRLEFIEHLKTVSDYAMQSEFEIDGHEVVGIDNDIAALRIYLALTCVDIFATNFQPFQQWVLEHRIDIEVTETIEDFLKRKSDEYERAFQIGPSFVSAFVQSPPEIVSVLQDYLSVRTRGGLRNDIEIIARFLYRIRNKYTHEGRRFHHTEEFPINQFQKIGPRDEEALIVSPGFDIVACILDVAIAQSRRKLGLS
jgi:hypothetical protein